MIPAGGTPRDRPRMLVTGSSGFIGRNLIDALKDEFEIFGIARRSQARSGAPVHPNIFWQQVDIGDREHLAAAFRTIQGRGGVDIVVHLAAHYDFSGDEDPEYWRTNVHGLRNVLDLSREIGIGWFVFSSSVAACAFPPAGGVLDERSPADGEHVYARTKAVGEAMVREYRDAFPSAIVRFAALFSDWCEYPPLFVFLNTWLSSAWNRGVLGGKGLSAIPYLHVREVAPFFRKMLERRAHVPPGDVLVASPDGSTSHRELFHAATLYHFGRRKNPWFVPRLLCRPGMVARDLFGRLRGDRPFERPWMARYVDLAMNVSSGATRATLSWAPRERLGILRRLPFLLENRKTDPLEWSRRNHAAMKQVRLEPNLRVLWLLERHEREIEDRISEVILGPGGAARFPTYQEVTEEQHRWNHRVVLRHLMNAVRTAERGIFVSYCADLAEVRFEQGFGQDELVDALEVLERSCVEVLLADPEGRELESFVHNYLVITVRFGRDQVVETYEMLQEVAARSGRFTLPGRGI